jgi:hypothetical protein
MGVIDGLKFKLTCPECGSTEQAYVADHGSGWSGSSWGSSVSFRAFQVTWKGGGREAPEVVTAACSKCGCPAKVDQRYGLD